MKQFVFLIISLSITFCAFSQTKMFINKTNGTSDSLLLSDIKNITFKTYTGKEFEVDANTIAMWHFNEFSGDTAYDVSGNNYNFILSKGAKLSSSGKFGGCLNFDSTLGAIAYTRANILDTLNTFTIEMWINNRTGGLLINKDILGTLSIDWYTYLSDSGRVQYWLNGNASNYSPLSSELLQPNVWTYVAVVRDKSNNKIQCYINGALSSEISIILNNVSAIVPLAIGQWSDPSDLPSWPNYSIDEIRISKIAKSAQDIYTAYMR